MENLGSKDLRINKDDLSGWANIVRTKASRDEPRRWMTCKDRRHHRHQSQSRKNLRDELGISIVDISEIKIRDYHDLY